MILKLQNFINNDIRPLLKNLGFDDKVIERLINLGLIQNINADNIEGLLNEGIKFLKSIDSNDLSLLLEALEVYLSNGELTKEQAEIMTKYKDQLSSLVNVIVAVSDKPELKVVDDQIGCPTWTVQLSDAIAKLLQGERYGIYHVCGSGKTSWYGFAKEVFKLAGLKVNLLPCTTDEFPRPAKRPKYSVMDNNKICNSWKTALKNYMNLREV